MNTQNRIKKNIADRLSKVTACQFQMMVNGVPYYEFSDLETGMRFERLAYGTEANWIMYRYKADLEKELTLTTMREAS